MNMTIELRDVSYTYAGKYQRVTAVRQIHAAEPFGGTEAAHRGGDFL